MADIYAQNDLFRKKVAARERAAASDMVQSFGQAWTRIRRDLDKLTGQIEAERKVGRQISTGWLFQQERLNSLLATTLEQVGEFARFAEDKIVNEQAAAVAAAQTHTAKLAEMQLPASRPVGVLASFQRLPTEALNDLVGFTADGSPLRALLDELGPSASGNVRKALIQGVATGANPRAIAREVRKELGGDLDRALVISRTEVLRSYRESSIRGMAANGVVELWRWNATKTTRTCAMCLAMDGQTFPVTTPFGSHPNCRCGPIPVTKYFTPKETGEEWFKRQTAADQEKVLGPGKYALYRDGKLKLTDLVSYREDKKWGPVRSTKSLKAVTKALGRQEDASPIKPLDRLKKTLQKNPPQVRSTTFDTTSTAEQWARQHIPGLQNINLGGVDPDVVSGLVHTSRAIAVRYQVEVPNIMPYAWEGWGEGRSAAFMAASRSGISFNPEMCTGLPKEEFLIAWELAVHTSKAGKGVGPIVSHEMAHIIAKSGRTGKGTLLQEETSEAIVRKFMRELRDELGQEGIIDELSPYAWYAGGMAEQVVAEDAWKETWAQAFSGYWENPELISTATRLKVEQALKELHRE